MSVHHSFYWSPDGFSIPPFPNCELYCTPSYHAIRIVNDDVSISLTEKIFIRCFLCYLRETGYIDACGVGGNGGHLAPAYFGLVKIPTFPALKKEQISVLYHNPIAKYEIPTTSFEEFASYDDAFNADSGIYDIDKSMQQLKELLDAAIQSIADDKEVLFFNLI